MFWNHWLSSLGSAVLLVLLGAAWMFFAPTRFGGEASYIIVAGNSMEPGFQRGDLAIVRAAPHYEVGDIATYQHPDIGPVIHRIVERNGNRFIMKGDNNTWLDSFEPSPSDFIGTLWIHVPHVGTLLEQLRSPALFPVLVALISMLAVASAASPLTTPRSARRRARGNERTASMKHAGDAGQSGLVAASAVALAFVLLAFLAFSQPLERIVADDIPYDQTGAFSYWASVPTGGIYDSDTVATGEPVFRRLADAVTFHFGYQFASERPHEVAGTYRLNVVISDPNGWKRTIELAPPTSFSGNKFSENGTLDLRHVQAITDSVEQETGLRRVDYLVAVAPEVTVHGTVAGREIRDSFSPRLTFRLDSIQLQVAQPGPRETDPFNPSQTGIVKGSRTEPNTLSLLGMKPDVMAARSLGVIGLGLSILAALVFGRQVMQALGGDEPTRMQAKYGPLLMAVRGEGLVSEGRTVEVSSIDDLAKLAEKAGHMILHEQAGASHHYVVQDTEVAYHYRTWGSFAQARESAAEAVSADTADPAETASTIPHMRNRGARATRKTVR